MLFLCYFVISACIKSHVCTILSAELSRFSRCSSIFQRAGGRRFPRSNQEIKRCPMLRVCFKFWIRWFCILSFVCFVWYSFRFVIMKKPCVSSYFPRTFLGLYYVKAAISYLVALHNVRSKRCNRSLLRYFIGGGAHA